MSLDGMLADNWVLLTKVVGRSTPFQRTVEPLTKLAPVTVRVKAGPPTMPEVGLRLEMTGTGTLTVICTVWLALNDWLNAVKMNWVSLSPTETTRVPCRSRPVILPRDSPLSSMLVTSPLTDQAIWMLLASSLPMLTSPGTAVKKSIFGVPGTGVGVGAGLTVTSFNEIALV